VRRTIFGDSRAERIEVRALGPISSSAEFKTASAAFASSSASSAVANARSILRRILSTTARRGRWFAEKGIHDYRYMGFYFSPTLMATAFEALLRRGTGWKPDVSAAA
jgi:hypothetical protein